MGAAGCKPRCQANCSEHHAAHHGFEEKAPEEIYIIPVKQAKDSGYPKGDDIESLRAFDVELVRIGPHWKTLGLLVSPDDNPRYLIVDGISGPSLISNWNASQAEDQRVRAGAVISSISSASGGSSNAEEMLAKIQLAGQGSSLKLRVHQK